MTHRCVFRHCDGVLGSGLEISEAENIILVLPLAAKILIKEGFGVVPCADDRYMRWYV